MLGKRCVATVTYDILDRKTYLREQTRLYKALIEDYDPRLPPVTMQVENASLSTLNPGADLPRFEVLLTLVFMKMEWRDERLQWNVSDHCGIEHIYLAISDVWIPEITIVEAHSSEDYREDYKKFVWTQDFPFDHQECYIKMMSQSFSAWEYGITITMSPGLADNSSAFALMGNGEWQIRNVSMQTVFVETGDQFPFEMSTFIIAMKRNSSFYITMVITPSFIINVLSIFGVFLRTADSMGKLGMALTNIMSVTFILGILATALPKTKDLPRIAIYVMVNLCIMVLALTITLILPYLDNFTIGRFGVKDSMTEKKNNVTNLFDNTKVTSA
ncbi:Neurotransmitter-gated ion-channel ligand binding domain protein [Ancylostoma ceylanicum]|uniref:Neurotransmitter-gated ion-channel ligand binding domain protein n=1 Tax=Ancylostoma ceylanicum TaxID=53326 RepID=A0A0D6LZH2_9BILA|nr:Neurotransmitter-gated ion-channel ligand binding domain protein [Ancylostoma ceylanicum]